MGLLQKIYSVGLKNKIQLKLQKILFISIKKYIQALFRACPGGPAMCHAFSLIQQLENSFSNHCQKCKSLARWMNLSVRARKRQDWFHGIFKT